MWKAERPNQYGTSRQPTTTLLFHWLEVATVGIYSSTSDGAVFMLVVSEELVKSLGLQQIARLAACSVAGVELIYMGIDPCAAIPKELYQAGMKLADIEHIELNEAFAAQALAVNKEGGLDRAIVNPNRGPSHSATRSAAWGRSCQSPF